ncbi:6252_t:CDS:2, partial [Paraglomus brasilianum]
KTSNPPKDYWIIKSIHIKIKILTFHSTLKINAYEKKVYDILWKAGYEVECRA